MRNYITPAQFDLPNVSIQVRQAPAKLSGRHPFDLIRDDRRRSSDTRSDLNGKTILPVSDFEGFGSFSG